MSANLPWAHRPWAHRPRPSQAAGAVVGRAPRRTSSVTRQLLVLVDAGGWLIGLLCATALVLQFDMDAVDGRSLAVAVAVAIAVHLASGRLLDLYGGAWSPGSRDDLTVLAVVTGATTVVLLLTRLAVPRLPLAAVLVAAPLTVVLLGAVRDGMYRGACRRMRPSPATAARTVVVGAGDAGSELVRTMLRSPQSPYLPVALVDDDARKVRLHLHGVLVHGGRELLADVVTRTRASTVVIAVAQADRELIQDVMARVAQLGVDVRVLPSPAELLTRPPEVEDLRPISPADLLGRQETQLDLDAIAGYLTGRRVLVTGAGGSIGSELCRQVAAFSPSRLVMLDRDESALHAVQLSMRGRALLDHRDVVVADIRDEQRLHAVFAEHHPEVVFHAAALKHLPLLQMHPGEALQTNVHGTLHLLRVCSAWGVERLVNISTDKAADPVSVLGCSKRITERLTSWWSSPEQLTAISVRFGNVLGSRGSVLTTFHEQIRRGGPVTVTDPDVTRYFMTVEEAVGLVVQAGAIGRSGEVLVLDMGAPVRILEVVQRLMQRANVDLEVQVTGLRPGEKLHEALLGADEADERPVHPMISQVAVPPLDPRAVEGLHPTMPDGDLVRCLRHLCTTSARPQGAAPPRRREGDVPLPAAADRLSA